MSASVHLVVDLHDPARVVVRLDRVRAPVHATREGRDDAASVRECLRVEPAVTRRREPVAAAQRDLAGRAGDRGDRAAADADVPRTHVRVGVVLRVAPGANLVPADAGLSLRTLSAGCAGAPAVPAGPERRLHRQAPAGRLRGRSPLALQRLAGGGREIGERDGAVLDLAGRRDQVVVGGGECAGGDREHCDEHPDQGDSLLQDRSSLNPGPSRYERREQRSARDLHAALAKITVARARRSDHDTMG